MPLTDTATNNRLELIQATVNVLSLDLPMNDFVELTGLIEALCRHRDLPIETCVSEPRLAILARLGVDITKFRV